MQLSLEREDGMSVWHGSKNTGSWVAGKRFSIDEPSVTIMAAGMAGDSIGHWHLFRDGRAMTSPTDTDKPPYRVPSMEEIESIPWNGLRVVSTFSGCGGSCLGYRMAGYRVVWANEFVPIAQESYRANAADCCILDCRDIRDVTAEEILQATGLPQGDVDIFDGSPPCQAFSTAGKREKNWGKEKTYEHGAKQCNENLFFEYVRLLKGLQPKVFIAENVSGLVKGTAKGMFIDIMTALRACGYKVACRVLDAQWLGVPQARQRTIFIGVRNDLEAEPAYPSPLPYRYSVRDALPWITKVESGPTGFGAGSLHVDKCEPTVSASMQSPYAAHKVESPFGDSEIMCQSGAFPRHYQSAWLPSPAVVAGRTAEMKTAIEKRKFSIAEVKRLCAFPDDFILCGSYSQQWERLGNSVPPVMMAAIASVVRDQILCPGKTADDA